MLISETMAPASKGVYFIQHDSARSASIRFLNEETGAVRVLQVLTKPLSVIPKRLT